MLLTPNTQIRNIINAYNGYCCRVPVIEGHYVKVDEDRARKIAEEYEALPECDRHPTTDLAYHYLAQEIEDQWQFAQQYGIQFEAWEHEGQPYATSEEMFTDVRENKHLYYFIGGEPHCQLGELNNKFRAIHDLFGHAAEGYGFGPRGEENAWIHHSQIFSPLAQIALTSETRGQNSWFNFGPYSNLPASERPFSVQKAALLPEWCCNWQQALKGE